MDRKWKSGASVTPPTLDNASDGYATAGNPGLGVPATKPGPHMFHMIVEEMLGLITAAGLTPDKTSVVQLLAAATLLYDSQGIDPGGRLTLTTGVPVTTADVSGATTIRYTPHMHDRIKLYDGTRWKWYTFTEMSQTLADATKSPLAATTNTNYDMFGWDDSGTLRCTRGPTWNAGAGAGSDTARGTGAGSTELEFFGGRWVNKIAITNGPAARRGLYLGSVRTDASSQANDTLTKRHVWNVFHQARRAMRAVDSTDTWTYTLIAYRQANGNAANQLDFLRGLNEDSIFAQVYGSARNSGTVADIKVAIGLDSVTTMAPGCLVPRQAVVAAASDFAVAASWVGAPGLGRHVLTWLESSTNIGTTTWNGDVGAADLQTGIHGEVLA